MSSFRPVLPFTGGAVGYLGYDAGFSLESKLSPLVKPGSGTPDSWFGFYNQVMVVDHLKNKLHLFLLGFPEKKTNSAKLLCRENFEKIRRILMKAESADKKITTSGRPGSPELDSNFSKADYLTAVRKAKEYIRCGDIYQVNLSQRFSTKTDLSSLELYRRLRKVSPANFSAYLDCGDFQVLSSSPERFLKVEGSRVITRPMKGTRPRGRNKFSDESFKKSLLKSPKDKAELMMIVDLERNDLGRVCDYNSIKVEKLREIEKYSTVFQTTATISGRLFKNKDRLDLLRASFPGGSVTGCPKIRAMEIIEELEPQRRGVYTGALGYLGFNGNMDFNILIRTILKKRNKLYFAVGGGIVADSKPLDEYRETLVKARGIIRAIS